jgi:DNA helicase-2/ATP-dependent DNA helicase PcrA
VSVWTLKTEVADDAPAERRPTPQQTAVYEAVRDEAAHVNVQAVAGSGKTTTAVGCADAAAGRRVGFVAFNKHIADELGGRLGAAADAMTLHALGNAAVHKAFPGATLDENKSKRLLERIRPRWAWVMRSGRLRWSPEGQATLALAGLCKKTLTPPTPDGLKSLTDFYGVDLPLGADDAVAAAVDDLLAVSADETAAIDFDDMLWLPARLGLPVRRFDVLLVDEAQDLSRCQQHVARSAGERLVVCGDENQSIYGFSGADPDSLPRLTGELAADGGGCLDRPLTVTFRCPRTHVSLAQQIVPQIQAAPGAADGEVWEVEPSEVPSHVRPGDLVIGRRNAPLVNLAFRLIRGGTPAVMLGRDFGKGLIDLTNRMNAAGTVDLVRKLGTWLDAERARLDRRDAPESQVQAVEDRAGCLIELAAAFDSVGALTAHIDRLFSDRHDRGAVVTLASVHRAKGSEADRVVVVEPGCLPLVGRKTRPWERRQEMNLAYVAATRAKRELIFAGPVPACLGGSSFATDRGPHGSV